MLIPPPILGRFWGSLTPKCSRILSRPPKRHILGRKHAFWRTDVADRSGNATSARAEESKKRKKTQRCDKWHICPDHPRCGTPTKVVMRGVVSDVVNHAKFHQNRLRGFILFICISPWSEASQKENKVNKLN